MKKFFNRKLSKFLFVFACVFLLLPNLFAAGGKESSPPVNVNRIISLAPSNTEILDGLGVANKLIAVDTYSRIPKGVSSDLPKFDMMQPDNEAIIALKPDLIITTGMSRAKGNNPFQPTIDAGVTILEIPSAASFEEVMQSIENIGAAVGKSKEAKKLNANLAADLKGVKEIAKTIPAEKRKTVYFEIAAAPHMYTTGSNTFQNEMLEACGAENIFKDLDSWASISEEQILAKNPDVILTSVDYTPDPVGEIKNRKGWKVIKAVKNGEVYQVETSLTNQPCQNLGLAVKEIAKIIYPEYFK